MKTYAKVHKTYEEQLALLVERGLNVSDSAAALRYLKNVGYYTLGGYLYSMRVLETRNGKQIRTDGFLKNATFEHAIQLYEYDRKLRHHCLKGLEAIERSFKVRMAYHIGKTDPLAHHTGTGLSPDAFKRSKPQEPQHKEWLVRHLTKLNERPNEEIRNWVNQYGNQIPIWIAIDAMDFGDAAHLLRLLDQSSQTYIAKGYGIQSGQQIVSWIRTCRSVRNYAAHHQRLWNRTIDFQPMRPKGREMQYFTDLHKQPETYWGKPYVSLLIMAYLIRQIDNQSQWIAKTAEIIESLPIGPGVTYEAMGVPKEWRANKTWT